MLRVEKQTEPPSILTIEFRREELVFSQSSSGFRTGSVAVSIQDEEPVFSLEGKPYSTRSLVESFLEPVLL